MDPLTIDRARHLLESILLPYTKIPYAHGNLHSEAIFDRDRDRYVLLTTGWERGKRVHSCLVHVDLIDGKFWIQLDGTEHGIATELEAAGVPRERIVLGFKPVELRRFTDYAFA
jgi:hypothetical protein